METSTIHPPNAQPDSLQTTLQTARKSKRLSQRHVSFVESGRAQPSRELLLSWLHELQAPLALRNVALQQASSLPRSTAAASWPTLCSPRCATRWPSCCKRTTPCPPW